MIRLTATCLVGCMLGAISVGTADAEIMVDVFAIVRETATPVGGTTTDTLPASITEMLVGASYVVEIWMQDTWDSSMPGGPSPGLTGGGFDLQFDPGLSQGYQPTDANYEGPFDLDFTHLGTVRNMDGLVDDFGAGTFGAGVGVTPNYARVGYILFDATDEGIQTFTLNEVQVARYSMGDVDQSEIKLHNASVMHEIPEPSTLIMCLVLGVIGLAWGHRP